MPKSVVTIVAALTVMMILWLSAVPLMSWYELSGHHEALDDAAFRWHHESVDTYSFEFDAAGPGAVRLPAPIRIAVRNGTFDSATRADNGRPYQAGDAADVPDSIDALFELASDVLERRPQVVEIDYHPERHFPTRIFAEFGDAGADRVTYFARSFRSGP